MGLVPADAVQPPGGGHVTDGDKCDRCGSQAYVRVELATGPLMFCAHHFQQYDARLRKVAIMVLDERARLYAEASRASSQPSTVARD